MDMFPVVMIILIAVATMLAVTSLVLAFAFESENLINEDDCLQLWYLERGCLTEPKR